MRTHKFQKGYYQFSKDFKSFNPTYSDDIVSPSLLRTQNYLNHIAISDEDRFY